MMMFVAEEEERRALVAWQQRARSFVQRQGWARQDHEDLVQEMLLYILEHARLSLSVQTVYWRALDHLYGRSMQAGVRRWTFARTLTCDPHHPLFLRRAHSSPLPEEVIFLAPPLPRERLVWALYFLGDYQMPEIGAMLDISASRVGQLLRKHLAQRGPLNTRGYRRQKKGE